MDLLVLGRQHIDLFKKHIKLNLGSYHTKEVNYANGLTDQYQHNQFIENNCNEHVMNK
jgi:hypothetical protein